MLSASANSPVSRVHVSRRHRALSLPSRPRVVVLRVVSKVEQPPDPPQTVHPFRRPLARAVVSRRNDPLAHARNCTVSRIARLARVDRVARTLALSSSLIRVDRLLEAFLALARFAPRTEAHRASFARAVDWKRARAGVESVRACVDVGDDVCGRRRDARSSARCAGAHKNDTPSYCVYF